MTSALPAKFPHINLGQSLKETLSHAWRLSRSSHGNTLFNYLPGMFTVNGVRGAYRAVSITGDKCELSCEHCQGRLLTTMPAVKTPDALKRVAMEARARGDEGILITGGCDKNGKLPWDGFYDAIAWIKGGADLLVSVHSGQLNHSEAVKLKESGVDQALVDIIGDDETAEKICHLPNGVSTIRATLDALFSAGLDVAPHIVFGLNFGELVGEKKALDLLANYPFNKYIVVVLAPTKGTPMESVSGPLPDQVAAYLALARTKHPKMEAGLGCARPRGKSRERLDTLAILAGVNSIAMAAEGSLKVAAQMGLSIEDRRSCCSIGPIVKNIK